MSKEQKNPETSKIQKEFLHELRTLIEKYADKKDPAFRGVFAPIVVIGDEQGATAAIVNFEGGPLHLLKAAVMLKKANEEVFKTLTKQL